MNTAKIIYSGRILKIMLKNITAVLLVSTLLGGCANFYTFEGKRYESKEEFHRAVETFNQGALSGIITLPKSISNRKLVFALPNESAILAETIRRRVETLGGQPNPMQLESYQALSKSNFKLLKVFYDAIQRKNIYASTQFIEMTAMTATFEASPDTDILYYVEPAKNSGQWFYISAKYGKQIFNFDRSPLTPAAKLAAFLDAVQLNAIRE